MASIIALFSQVEGGYPHAVNSSTTAITDDGSDFYIDQGKLASYGDMIVFNVNFSEELTNSSHTINGIELIINGLLLFIC